MFDGKGNLFDSNIKMASDAEMEEFLDDILTVDGGLENPLTVDGGITDPITVEGGN